MNESNQILELDSGDFVKQLKLFCRQGPLMEEILMEILIGNIDGGNIEAFLQARSPDGGNPWCPAEPNLPWMLVRKRVLF